MVVGALLTTGTIHSQVALVKKGKPVSRIWVAEQVHIEGVKVCPPWHCGVGHPAWFFMDEIRVL